MSAGEIYTIGHSTRTLESFISLLKHWNITGLADVRSSPWSRFNPHFNRPELKRSLGLRQIDYRFFGRQLGGRPDFPQLYRDGVANYEAMAETAIFHEGLDLVTAGAEKHRLALMCSEHDPLECHRCLLVGRALSERGYSMRHILSHEEAQTQKDIEGRILKLTGNDQHDLLCRVENPVVEAYREWSKRVAYSVQSEPVNVDSYRYG